MDEKSFIEFIHNICSRPAMYTEGSVKETIAYIDGYRFGGETPISNRDFDKYVCIRNSIPTNYVWDYSIKTCTNNDADAFKMIEEMIVDFVKLKESMPIDEIFHYAAKQIPKEEGEAAKVFREFDHALLLGKESLISALIEANKNAEILWSGSYPEDVAEKLLEISSSQPIKCIPLSDNGNHVRIIASGWPFPIEMNFKNGKWKVNADPIIKLRMFQKSANRN
jgi:hypothetical protein